MNSLYLLIPIGFIVGFINAISGGASTLSFPVLLALGLNPIAAATTNSLGISNANLFALIPQRGNIKKLFLEYRSLIVISCLAAIAGSVLLLAFPEKVFSKIAPFLLLFASLSILLPMKPGRVILSTAKERVLIAFSGIYSGYFGPGSGIIVIATLLRSRSYTYVNTGKNIISGVTNIFCNAIYIASGEIRWGACVLLFTSSAAGAITAGRVVTHLPIKFLRVLVAITGTLASFWLMKKYL